MRSKNLTWGILIFYWAALAWIIVFKMSLSFAGLPHLRNINLIPFAESVIVNGHLDTTEIFQNLAAFVDRWKILVNAVCILCGGLLAALIVVLIAANL